MAGREHLHHDHVPATLAILADLLDHRSMLPDGYERTEHGAWVDWEALGRSWLSSTEVAGVHIARGYAIAECPGGLPLSVAGAVRTAVEELTGWWAITPAPNISDTDGGERVGVEAQGLVEPVGLDPVGLVPYHPYDQCRAGEPGADSHVERWREGPAWSHRRPARCHRSADLPAVPEPGCGPDL